MSASPSRKSLLRLILGAALVLLGWVLASATSAHADDRGPLDTVVAVGDTTLDVTEAAAAAPEDAAQTAADDAVSSASRVADEASERTPAAAPTRAVTSTVRTATKRATSTVVSPVVDTVERTTVEVGSLPGAALPAIPEVETPLVPTTDAPAPAPVAVEQALTQRAADADDRQSARAIEPATGSWVAPLFGAGARDGTSARASAPSGPEPVVPTPAPHSVGLVPGWAPGAGQGGASPVDASMPWGGAGCPEPSSAATSSDGVRPRPGPAEDPGSRPG